MTKAELYAHPGWRWCTSEGAREQVLRLGLESTLREKIQWLEDMETLSLRLRAQQLSHDARDSEKVAGSESDGV